jgi:hypothetical protein
MWAFLRRIVARSQILNSTLGEVVYETLKVPGQTSRSFLQWRVKTDLGGQELFVGLKMLPDAYAGAEGSPTNYMNFDIESARLLRSQLDLCIAECDKRMREIPVARSSLS